MLGCGKVLVKGEKVFVALDLVEPLKLCIDCIRDDRLIGCLVSEHKVAISFKCGDQYARTT